MREEILRNIFVNMKNLLRVQAVIWEGFCGHDGCTMERRMRRSMSDTQHILKDYALQNGYQVLRFVLSLRGSVGFALTQGELVAGLASTP